VTISVQTLVVAIITGLGAGLVGTMLRNRHERREAFRDRLLTSADDLATGILQAIIGLDDARRVCLEHGGFDSEGGLVIRDPATGQTPDEIKRALRRSEELINEARARQARIALLFGPVSAPDRAATIAMFALKHSHELLDGWPRPDLEKQHAESAEAKRDLDRFCRSALADIQGRPWYASTRVGRRVKAQIRRWRDRVRPESRSPDAVSGQASVTR
jgi:hypothetical protein